VISAWNDAEPAGFERDPRQRVFSSRRLGQGPSLVLRRGGNTSPKARWRGEALTKTTGAQMPIDGGNERVI